MRHPIVSKNLCSLTSAVEDEDDDANLSHGEDDEDDGEDSNQSLPWQLKNPIAHAVSEHEQSEALAARYRHKERLPPATQTPRDEETITERLREIFGDSLAVTMTVDDSPLWQVPVKVSYMICKWLFCSFFNAVWKRGGSSLVYPTTHTSTGGPVFGKIRIRQVNDARLHIRRGFVDFNRQRYLRWVCGIPKETQNHTSQYRRCSSVVETPTVRSYASRRFLGPYKARRIRGRSSLSLPPGHDRAKRATTPVNPRHRLCQSHSSHCYWTCLVPCSNQSKLCQWRGASIGCRTVTETQTWCSSCCSCYSALVRSPDMA